MEEIIFEEDKLFNDDFQVDVDELKKMSDFFKSFVNYFDIIDLFKEKNKAKKENSPFIYQSFLLSSLAGIYDSFQVCMKNIKNIMTKIQNEIIKPLDDFRSEQLKIYKNNLNKIKEMNKIYNKQEILLEKAKNNYYKASLYVKNDKNKDIQYNFKNEDLDNSLALSIKNKMIAKNYECLYRYELARYNKVISNININYEEMKNNLEIAEKNRIYFIKESLDKYKNSLNEFNKEFNNFINILERYSSSEVCDKEYKITINKINQFKKNECRLPLKSFISFKNFYEKSEEKLDDKKLNFENKELDNLENEISNMKNEELTNILNDILNDLLKKEDINPEKNGKLFDIIQSKKKEELWNIFIDCLFNKYNEISVIKFSNEKNLENLANCLNYISLQNDSIFTGNFELNVKIIFIAVKIFYINEKNNDKIYLSAVLSKNKYLRTSQFWRNYLEFKLANKLSDAIKRFNDVFIFKDGKRKGLLSKIGGAIGLNSNTKTGLLSKNKILPLIEHYNDLDNSKVEVLDKIATQEMLNLIKDNIPDMTNFNYPPELCLDLIAKLIEDYKISKKNMKYLVIYTNVCSCSIRKLLKTEENIEKNKISNFKKPNGKIKLFKLLKRTIPYLKFEDYNKLLLCSKETNKKLKKKIYAHVLKQKDVNNKIRLYIWENILGVRELKKKYKYEEILSKANDEKVLRLITLDVARTSVKDPEKEKEIKKQLINVLYAVSQFSEDINYYQGMQYIVLFLMEIYGEQEAFYLFLSFFLNTEYSLLFEKDLKKLKIFFYVFKRIISLFEPELSSFLNINNMQVDLFLPPWFITLFSGTHHFLRKKEDNTPVIIRCIDYFILFSWKSMMSIGCALLHLYEGDLMKLDYEGLMRFLLNDILKMDFFLNKNQDIIEKCMEEFKISKKLISNIEAEFSQEIKPKENNN